MGVEKKERLGMDDYQAIRNRLTLRHQEIQERLTRVSRDLRHADAPLATLLEEQSIEIQNDEVLAALDDSIRAEMERIEQALARLDRGEYGTCEHCGRLIPVRRLEALPFTSSCVECEAARERVEGTPPTPLTSGTPGSSEVF